MPRGLDGVRKASADIERRRSQGGPGAFWFKIGPGEEAVVRFLENNEDLGWCWVHTIPIENRQWGRPVPCCNQDDDGTACPGCEHEMDRTFKGYINIIWEDAPVYKKDKDGKIVRDTTGDPVVTERKTQVALLSSGIRLFDILEDTDTNYRGLMSRPFKIKRKGTGFDTKYTIVPAEIDGGPKEMTAADEELAKDKYDLSKFITPPTYEEFERELYGKKTGNANSGQEESRQGSANPFMRRQNR